MKIIKTIMFIGTFLIITLGIIIFIARRPSYTIRTSGKLFIVNKLSSSISIFDLNQGKTLVEIPINVEPHEIINITKQKKVVVTNYGAPDFEGNSITIINAETNKIEKTIDLNEEVRPHGIVNVPNSNKVAVVTDKYNNLLLIDLDTGEVEKKISTKQKFSHLLAIHQFKPLVYVTNSKSNSVSVVDLLSDEVIKIIHCENGTEGIDITPDGSEIWVTNDKENTIQIIDPNSHRIINSLNTDMGPSRLKFSVDGKYCLVTNANAGTISVFSVLQKKRINTIYIPGKRTLIEKVLYHSPRPVGIFMHPNGLYAFVANSNADKIEVIDMKTFKIVSTIGTGRVPDGLTVVN